MDTYLKIFIVAASVAIILQAGILIATYLRLAKFDQETRELRRQLNEQSGPILRNVNELSLAARENTRLILDDLTALSADARRQMDKVDRLTDEMADRLRVQIIRLDELLMQALDNVERAGSTVKDSVSGPMKEAAAVVQGVKAAVDFINARRGRSRTTSRSQDEQLFI